VVRVVALHFITDKLLAAEQPIRVTTEAQVARARTFRLTVTPVAVAELAKLVAPTELAKVATV
jgi:hypothetical protein